MRLEDGNQLAKDLARFSKEVLIFYILKHCWRDDKDDMLWEMRFKEWEIKSAESLKKTEKENEESSKLAEKISKMPTNTDKEKLACLKEKQRLFEMFKRNTKLQTQRDKELDRLYEAIDGKKGKHDQD